MNGFEAYKLYTALRLHFTTNYDYFQYKGKTHVTQSSYLTHKNKYSFEKVAKKYNKDLPSFFLSNMVENPKIWIFDMGSSESNDIYVDWLKRTQSLSYLFENEIDKVFSIKSLNELIEVKSTFPLLLVKTLQKDVSIESLIIMNNILKFFSMWDKKVEDDIIWKEFKQKCLNYSPFLKYDEKKYKSILKKVAKNYT